MYFLLLVIHSDEHLLEVLVLVLAGVMVQKVSSRARITGRCT